MNVGDPNRHRLPEPHVQTMRVPTMADIDFAALPPRTARTTAGDDEKA